MMDPAAMNARRWASTRQARALRCIAIVRAIIDGERMAGIAERFGVHVSRVSQIAVQYHAGRRRDAGVKRA